MCFVWIWEQTGIISLYSIDWPAFLIETDYVLCEVEGEFRPFPQCKLYNFLPIRYTRHSVQQPLRTPWRQVRGVELWLHPLLTSTPNGGKLPAAGPGCFNPGEESQCLLSRSGHCREEDNLSPLPEFQQSFNDNDDQGCTDPRCHVVRATECCLILVVPCYGSEDKRWRSWLRSRVVGRGRGLMVEVAGWW